MTGIEALLDVLASSGVSHVFGNPGSTELPLNEALTDDPRFRYIFGLQEVPVVAMADGYAMASGHVGVANVHVACGLGNAMGMLYNAFSEGTPLVLTAGQQDRRLRLAEPVLAGDMVSVARPWTKWAVEVQRVEDMPVVARRALQVALTPPTGPVFISLPVDVQMESRASFDLTAAHIPDRRVRPPLEALQRAADILASADRPAILAGSRVAEAGAWQELTAVAERLGAPVYSESSTSHGRLPMATDHDLYAGALPYWSPEVLERLGGHDALLVVGMNLLRLYIHHEPECPIPDGIRVVHLDNVPREIGKNYGVDVGLIGDPKAGLEELTARIAERLSPAGTAAAHRRREECAKLRAAAEQTFHAEAAAQHSLRPMSSVTLMHALARVFPSDGVLVEEAPTTHGNALEKLGVFTDPSARFAHRGWALGWGLGCALGVKLAWPDRPVLALLGDGSALYGIQGLWTAAHHGLPVTFVVSRNREYRILKRCGGVMGLANVGGGASPGLDLVDPDVDFVALAQAFGVRACRVAEPDELEECVRGSLAGDDPLLIEVPIG